MLIDLSLIPSGYNPHLSAELAKALQLVDASGLPYQLTPSGTCIQWEWEEVMAVIRHCHNRVRKSTPHVVTLIKIEDDEGEKHKLTRNLASVEEKVSFGHPLERPELEFAWYSQSPVRDSPSEAPALLFEGGHHRGRADTQYAGSVADAAAIERHRDHLQFDLWHPPGVVIPQ